MLQSTDSVVYLSYPLLKWFPIPVETILVIYTVEWQTYAYSYIASCLARLKV